ncbi:MAG: hypothetical protein RLZZ127_1282 [Planctomycetota bacterium]|jgi:hypothetical protein
MTRRRRILWSLAILAFLPLAGAAAAWAFRDRIALAIVRDRLASVFAVPVELDGIRISPGFDRISLRGLRIGRHHQDPATPLVRIDAIDAEWSPTALLDRRVVVSAVRIDGVGVLADRLADGSVTLAGLLTPAPSATPAGPVAVPEIAIDGIEITGIQARLRDAMAATTPWQVTVDGASLAVHDLRLAPGGAATARFRGVVSCRIAMPPGFGAGDLADLPGIAVVGDLLPDRLRIGSAVAVAPALVLSRPGDGPSNLDEALLRLRGIAGAPASAAAAPRRPGLGLELAHIRILGARAEVRDPRIAAHPLRVEDVQCGVDDLWIHPAAPATAAARVRIDGRILQPAPHPPALVAIRARSAALPATPASAAVAVALTGFAFDTVDALVPTGARSAIGAEGFDAVATARLADRQLRIEGAVTGDLGVRLPFRAAGSATAPELAGSPLALAIANRLGGSLVNAGQGILGTGVEVVGGGVGAVWDVGSGVVTAGADLGTGLFRIVKGAVTLDGDTLGAGARQATVGTLGSLGGGLADAGRSLAGAGTGSLDAMTGDRERAPWRAGIPGRHDEAVVGVDLVLAGATVAITVP